MQNPGSRILETLNYPLVPRCIELGLLIDRCSLKELQDLFPVIINSIFGINSGDIGWGLRVISQSNQPNDFDVLYNFFIPLGPMFRLCYRLLNDALKYEIPLSFFSTKMQQMFESGRYPTFYSDVVNIDPFQRQIVSLSLNAFDYFMFHFAIHGTKLIQSIPTQHVKWNWEKEKTLYFFLTADYVCSFMPSNPYAIVMPQNICGSIKTSPISPLPVIQPTKSPKYLQLSALSHHAVQTAQNLPRTTESPRVHAWRTESVLYIFVDTWLRYDVDDNRDLPNNEFIRCVRVLVKQLHAFGNSADIDNSNMAVLRQVSQSLINTRIYTFLKSIISRWPLLSSFSDVLELYLTYIQPWRYTFNRDSNNSSDMPITQKHEQFIQDNLIIYTQIFILLLPRFERLDLSTLKNVFMLYRLLKVFSQTNLISLIQRNENLISINNMGTQQINQPELFTSANVHTSSPIKKNLKKNSNFFGGLDTNMNSSMNNEWKKQYNKSFDTPNISNTDDETYIFMFGDEVREKVQDLIRKIIVSKFSSQEALTAMENEFNQKYKGIWKYVMRFTNNVDLGYINTLKDRKRIPEILDYALGTISGMFDIFADAEELKQRETDLIASIIQERPCINSTVEDEIDSVYDNFSINGSSFDKSSLNLSPHLMKNRVRNLHYTGDPELLPIGNNEFVFLVRIFYQISSKMNYMFGENMNEFWNRQDIVGKLSRKLLQPPFVAQYFDKTQGVTLLQYNNLGPRVSLRFLASYKTAFIIFSSMCFGHLMIGSAGYGFFFLCVISFLIVLVRSVLSI